MPIVLSDGTLFGTLCAADPEPGAFVAGDVALLLVLARIVATAMERDREMRARAEAEARLRHANATLEQHIQERTAELEAVNAALRASEARHRQMFENHPAMQLLLDPASGRIVDANPAACAFYGYSREQLTAMSAHQLSARPAADVEAVLARASATPRDVVYARPHLANGVVREVEIRTGPVEIDGRRLIFSILHDVTERTRAEEARRASEENLAAAQRIAHLGSWEWEVATGALSWSDETFRIFGLAPGSVAPTFERFLAAVHPDDRAATSAAIEVALAGGPYATEMRVVRPDGAIRVIEAQGEVIRDGAGVPVRMVGTGLDITERTRAAEALRKSERDYRELFERANDAIIIFDPAGEVVLDVNTRACEMYGRPRDQLIGASLRDFTRDVARGERYLRALVADGQSTSFETVHYRSDGTPLHLLINAAMIEFGGRRAVLSINRDITERERHREELHHLAYFDSLTGLPNRNAFTARLVGAITNVRRRPGHRVAILFLDLDNFKVINDSLGHLRGDRMLCAVAERLRGAVPTGAVVARFGGDEFGILLDGITDETEAVAVAERIEACLRTAMEVEGYRLFTTASIGVAVHRGEANPGDMLRDADLAMYQAKAQGRAGHAVFDVGMHERATEKLALETDLRGALEREQFRLAYQPIVALATSAITGFEALVRWEHPSRGELAPGTFIPLAEETGLIVPLGAWVLRAACRQLREWHLRMPRGEPLTMGVNLSGRQLAQPDLVGQVEAVLAETGIPPASLHLEITESVLVANTQMALTTLQRLRGLGVGIYLDDFGVEYSSLNYLRRFPIDAIKIDRAFVAGCTVDGDDRTVMAAMVGLARSLGVGTTAEGIESGEQLACVRELGCDRGQGYFFAQPLSAEEVIAFAMDGAPGAVAAAQRRITTDVT